MAVTEAEFEQAKARALTERRANHVRSTRYNWRRERVIVQPSTGVEVTIPVALAEGLVSASPEDLAEIEISPTGLGLHWPRLDVDLYVPALRQGVFGTRNWMASQMGAAGGKSRSSSHNGRSTKVIALSSASPSLSLAPFPGRYELALPHPTPCRARS